MTIEWSYGITTVASRGSDLLPQTVASLAKSGFDNPVLFVDKIDEKWAPPPGVSDIVTYQPGIGHLSNWMTSILYLYTTKPNADRYALFEDDLVCCQNLRKYLEKCTYPKNGYWNLLTHDCNLRFTGKDPGWHPSNQKGKGAVGLVFNLKAVQDLLTSAIFIERPASTKLQAADGVVIDSLQPKGYTEYVHFPSLIQHTGIVSSMPGHKYGMVKGFESEEYDPLPLVPLSKRLEEGVSPMVSRSKVGRGRTPGRAVSIRRGPQIRQLRLPQYGWLPPIHFVQIQTHSRCNADCVFCPYIESAHAANHGRMTDEVWNLILVNLVPFQDTINKGKICPYLMQEPMIDKTIFAKIEDIYKYFPQTCVEISTNGAALNEASVDKLLASMEGKKHDIWVSHHGINKETFEHIMKIDYEKATANLFYLLRQSNGRFNIKIRGAGEGRNGKHAFFTRDQYVAYWTDQFATHGINTSKVSIDAFVFHDRAGTLHRADRDANTMNVGIVRKIDPAHPFHCNRVDEWVHFMYDGTIRLCCMDYHGEVKLPNIKEVSLLDYYHGPEYASLVEQISGRKGCAPGHICTRCISPGG